MVSLFAPFMKYIAGGLGIALLIFIGLWKMEQRRGDKLERRVVELVELRKTDRKAYEAAQAEAERLNRAEIERIRKQQEANNDEVSSDLASRLELIRRELRLKGPASGSPPKGPGAGQTLASPCTVTDPAWMCLSPEVRLRAAENEERHDQLITLVEKQSQVQP